MSTRRSILGLAVAAIGSVLGFSALTGGSTVPAKAGCPDCCCCPQCCDDCGVACPTAPEACAASASCSEK